MKPNICPKDCPKREGGCHATCKDYATAKQEYEAEKEKILREKRKEANVTSAIIENKKRGKKER